MFSINLDVQVYSTLPFWDPYLSQFLTRASSFRFTDSSSFHKLAGGTAPVQGNARLTN